MKEILRPAVKLLNRSASSLENRPMIKKGGVATIGFGVAFWTAYLLFKGLRK